jgi:hypothetical protein
VHHSALGLENPKADMTCFEYDSSPKKLEFYISLNPKGTWTPVKTFPLLSTESLQLAAVLQSS